MMYDINSVQLLHLLTMKALAVLIVLSALIAIGSSQNVLDGTCTIDQEIEYAVSLGLTCAAAIGVVDPNTPDSYNPDVAIRSSNLATVCTRECGGALADWLENNCMDVTGSVGLRIWCTESGLNFVGRDWCYFAVPPQYNLTNTDVLAACEGYTLNQPCPSGCAAALTSVVGDLGCCYQTLYNDTFFLGTVVAAQYATAQEVSDLQLVRAPRLWEACGVALVDQCEMSTIVAPPATAGSGAVRMITMPLSITLMAILFYLFV